MDWTGIAAVLAVVVSAISAVLNFRQQSYNRQQEYLIKKREEADKAEREREQQRNKVERDQIKIAGQAVYRELGQLFRATGALRAYIVQPHPLDKAKFISVQYELLSHGMVSVAEQVQRLPIGSVGAFVAELMSRDFVIWNCERDVKDGRARAMMHNFGTDRMVAKRMMEGEVWLGSIVLDFEATQPVEAAQLRERTADAANIIKYILPEIEEH